MQTMAIHLGHTTFIGESFASLKLKEHSFGELVADSVLYNSTSYLEEKKPEEITAESPESYAARGNCTEQGLIRFFLKQCGHSIIFTRQEERTADKLLLYSIPFDSKYKMSFAVIQDTKNPKNVKIFGKGAPDFLLQYCSLVLNKDGAPVELTDDEKNKINHDVIKMNFAKKSYRTILTAYKEMPKEEFHELIGNPQNAAIEDKIKLFGTGMTMISLFGL